MTGSSFPEFITSRRRELDLTLGDVATRLGVSPITVSNWSNGDSRPKPQNLVALADLLEVPADDLAKMAGISLGTPDVAVNLMPAGNGTPEEPSTDEVVTDEPVAAVRMSEPAPPTDLEAAEVPIPAMDDAVPVAVVANEALVADTVSVADAAPSADDAPDPVPAEEAPDSVPAFVAAASKAAPRERATRRPSIRRQAARTVADDRPVTVLPLTYIEDPQQLMRYRIRWALTVVVLAIMFLVLLWASRELLSALSEVKQAVTPGGIGSG
jgi:transcriptional regulator with XRE-family HTH domain